MPRSLTRLRYRAPLPPLNFARLAAKLKQPEGVLEQKVTKHITRQSNPRDLKLQIVLNPKARRPTTGQFHPHPWKPFTLRDVVDPEGKARHGEIIYIFRNIKTNQVIYSLQELMHDHHLNQLPFIGRHSKPPVIRPDEWTPHCVLTFPTAEQGHNAYRKLREFRKLHESSWDKNNPEWKRSPVKARMKKIMDQRANTTADIAEVLKIQELHGEKMRIALKKQQAEVKEVLDKKWAEIDSLANAAVAKEKLTDSVKWLEHQIRSLTSKLNMKHNQKEADQRRLKNAKIIQEIRLRKITYAQRKAEQFKTIQDGLTRTAAPAEEPGAETKLAELKTQAAALKEALANPDPTRHLSALALDANLLKTHTASIKSLEEAFAAKSKLSTRDHHIARSVLPKPLKTPLPTPYTLAGLRIRWADLQDALYAVGKWREAIEHETLDVYKARNETLMLSVEEFEAERRNEVSGVLAALEEKRVAVEEKRVAWVGEKRAARGDEGGRGMVEA